MTLHPREIVGKQTSHATDRGSMNSFRMVRFLASWAVITLIAVINRKLSTRWIFEANLSPYFRLNGTCREFLITAIDTAMC